MNKKQKSKLIRIAVSLLLSAAVFLLLELLKRQANLQSVYENCWVRLFLFLIPYLVIGYDVLLKAFKGICRFQPFDEHFLMAAATVGAMLLGEYTEGVAVMIFYQVGELFESIAVGKSRKNITSLMDIRPDYANVTDENGRLVQTDPDNVAVGTVIYVKPGEKIPIDGVIVDGQTSLNTAAITGESVPREVAAGDEVSSGCINIDGLLKIRTTKEFGQSTASRILELVESASSKKSRSENFISKFAKYYTPAVCFSALALAVLPPLFILLVTANQPPWGTWIYRALTFLVISCPCALVISIPLSFFAGIGGASASGILIKGSNYIETLAKVKTVVFDKTGTMTKGVFEVTDVHNNKLEESQLIRLAAMAESYSTHPISKSLLKAYGKEIDKNLIYDVKEISGHGVCAVVEGKKILVGNSKLMVRENIEFTECSHSGTVVHVAVDSKYMGHIVITDIVKPQARPAVEQLKDAGVKNIVMLTGDAENPAREVARELGITQVYSELLPQDKVTLVEDLLSGQPSRQSLAFVGDGINDAPVLTRADVGISMGAMGSDAAIEASDVVLMDDNPVKIAKAISIAKKCMRIVYQNITCAIGVKAVCLVFGALGLANMWLAVFADVGVMVLAVLNAIRVLFVSKL